jgi:phage baseplate assembly protein V
MPVELEYGEVSAVDYMGCRIRVRIDERDGVESYWISVPQRATKGTQRRQLLPEIGEEVAVLIDADGVGGIYLGGIYSSVEPPPVTDEDTDFVRFRDGTVVAYDQAKNQLDVDCVGGTTLKCARGLTVETGGAVVVKAPTASLEVPAVSLTGNLTVTGNVEVVGNVHATGTILDDAGNSSNHRH